MDSATFTEIDTHATSADVVQLEREYLLQNYARYPLVLRRGKGCYVYDLDGKRYLDLVAGIGVSALGHAHPRIVKAIREQAGLLIHTSNLYFHEYQGKLAKKLAEVSGLSRTFFCNSGTEAIEGAIKMMHSHGRQTSEEKYEIVSLSNSFHGRTIGALAITGQPKYRMPFEPLMPGVKFIPVNDVAALEQVVSEKTAGIVLEGIQGEGGIYPLSTEFVRKARDLADRYDALMVADEIQCGVGRPGTYFAYQLHSPVIMPDIMVAAKPVGCGVPLGVIVVNERAAKSIAPGMHGSTFGGGALACRVGLEFMEILDTLLPSIQQVGAYFRIKLDELAHKYSIIKEVRTVGLMLGVEFAVPCKQLVNAAMAEGLLINVTHDTVLRMLPPYILTEQQVDQAMKGLTKIVKNFKPEA
jgi:predicted acetylornithine/succinylornithine family transaminase